MTKSTTMKLQTTLLLAAMLLLSACDDHESKIEELAIGSAETGAAGCHHLIDSGSIKVPENPNQFQIKMIAAIRKGCME